MHDIGFESHNHEECVSVAMDAAVALCADKRLQFTPVRRRVLEILLEQHRAMGAYDILAVLSEEGLGSQPPVVYRALDFLTKHGLVHKIERLNAYLACTHPGESHSPLFMICLDCGSVAESAMRLDGLEEAAAGADFEIQTTVVEAEGHCPLCRKDDAQ